MSDGCLCCGGGGGVLFGWWAEVGVSSVEEKVMGLEDLGHVEGLS